MPPRFSSLALPSLPSPELWCALAHAPGDDFAILKAHGTAASFLDRMLDFNEIDDLVGTAEMLDIGCRYE